MWHSLRRKWATERKGYPLKDVAFAGGWRTERTMLSSYQQADAETVRQVVLHCEKLTTQRALVNECVNGVRRRAVLGLGG